MKKFFCKLLRCCPQRSFSMEDAIRRLDSEVRPEHSFRITDIAERSTVVPSTRHFEIAVYASNFMFARDESLEVAVNKIIATYRQQG